jgi:prepilin-type N-terminal cleavage/methylation domain-containing protein
MAARQVMHRQRGFTLAEMMVAVAICAILVAIAANAMAGSRKIARVSGEARFLVQRLQGVRANAVSQGNAQGYYLGPNGLNVVAPDAHQGFVFIKKNPTATPVTYDAVNDRQDPNRDWLPYTGTSSLVVVSGASGVQPAPFTIGFDINGQATVNPAAAFPYCIQVTDSLDPAVLRYVILFNDGTVKVQKDETWCP